MTAHMPSASDASSADPGNARPAGRFLSKEECTALTARVTRFAVGGGETDLSVDSTWTGNVRWARNQVSTCGDVRNNRVDIARTIRGANNHVVVNVLDDANLEAAVRRAERLLIQVGENLESPYHTPYIEPYATPTLWFDRTYHLDSAARAEAMRTLAAPAAAAGMLSSGYLEVSAHGSAIMRDGRWSIYYPHTQAQFSVTVRDPQGTGSGWAGVDWRDWGRIDAQQIAAVALDKCLKSRNPVAVEPGRYTAILEPQAVCDLVAPIFDPWNTVLDRYSAEDRRPPRPFSGPKRGETKIGQQLLDGRLTISADPTDPDLGMFPFALDYGVDRGLISYHPVKWFENGVLKELAYTRDPYGIREMGLNTGLPNSGAFRMSGGTTTVDEMIATTQRGILVTRFSMVHIVDQLSMMLAGYTRDGLWLVEHGKISKPIKPFRFTDSPLFALNNLEQIGIPMRVFRPEMPAIVPALKVRDFGFTSLSEAV